MPQGAHATARERAGRRSGERTPVDLGPEGSRTSILDQLAQVLQANQAAPAAPPQQVANAAAASSTAAPT
eukprot:8723396-Alexandrium_andersonii.AAC.1